MRIKVDPRTGAIVRGNARPVPPPPHAKKSRQKSRQNDPQRSATEPAMLAAIDPKLLMEMAEKIGHIIGKNAGKITGQMVAEALQALPAGQSQALTVGQLQVHGAVQSQVHDAPKLDESVIDVGIGQMDELKRGKGSAILGKEDTQTDTGLAQAANKLRALKRGK